MAWLLAGLGIYDTMQYVKPDISTLCIGQAASMGSFLLAAGTKGNEILSTKFKSYGSSAFCRFSRTGNRYRNSCKRSLFHLKERLNEIYSKHTGKTVDEVKSALERDNFMTADTAKVFGLIDEVVEKRS